MNSLKFFKKINEKFSAKIFIIIILIIIIVSSTFTAFFIKHQSRALKDNLINKGEILSELLAYSSRLGVFSENEELLKDPVEGILHQEEILEIFIFSREKRLLMNKKNNGINIQEKVLYQEEEKLNEIFNKIKVSLHPIHIEKKGRIEFWSPVIASSGYSSEEQLFMKDAPLFGKDNIIGFVGIGIDKKKLRSSINNLLLNSVLIGIIFLLIGVTAVFFVVKGITRPLKKLTEAVNTLGLRGSVKSISIETKDEIGKLAIAFNNMSESLKKRESEKEHLEIQLRHSQKMEAIGTLAGGIAHDFNNILTAIMGYASLLKLKINEYSSLQYDIDQIVDCSKRAAELTKSLLAYSRKQMLDPKPLNCNELIRNVKKLLVRLISEDIEFNLNLTEDDLIVMVDSGQMDQVMFNLVTNASDAMPDGGVLTITTESVKLDKQCIVNNENKKSRWFALIKVKDTGIGIDSKTLERIFDPFFTTKEVGKGTGLGLSTVYGIIKQHNGFIEVNSEPAKGTEFSIYLPLISDKQRMINNEEKSLHTFEGGSETVLIAEDDEHIRKISRKILKRYGYNVIDVGDGEDAIRNFIENKEQIKLLLFDVIMPKKDGKEAYEEIKKIKPNIKALFLSGYDNNIIIKKGILENGINFIYKPLSPEKLLRKVREILDN